MKLSFSTLGSPFYSVKQIIDLAAANKFDGVELRAVSGTDNLLSLDDFKGEGLKRTAADFKSAGLEVSCVGTGVRFNVASKEAQQKALEQAKGYLDVAVALNSPYLRCFGGPIIPTQGYIESIEWIREGYEKLGGLARPAGVMPLLETHDDFSTSARINDILGKLSADNIGVLWDILHPFRFGEAFADTYAALKNKIRHIHVKDSNEFSPKGFDLALPGEGKLAIKECLDLLKNGGFDGYYSFEWEKFWHPEVPDADVAIPHYAKEMAKYK